MPTQLKTARKPHRCTSCGRLIPAGHKYWGEYKDTPDEQVDIREHTDCLLYERMELLPEDFNSNRSKYTKSR